MKTYLSTTPYLTAVMLTLGGSLMPARAQDPAVTPVFVEFKFADKIRPRLRTWHNYVTDAKLAEHEQKIATKIADSCNRNEDLPWRFQAHTGTGLPRMRVTLTGGTKGDDGLQFQIEKILLTGQPDPQSQPKGVAMEEGGDFPPVDEAPKTIRDWFAAAFMSGENKLFLRDDFKKKFPVAQGSVAETSVTVGFLPMNDSSKIEKFKASVFSIWCYSKSDSTTHTLGSKGQDVREQPPGIVVAHTMLDGDEIDPEEHKPILDDLKKIGYFLWVEFDLEQLVFPSTFPPI